MSFQVARNDNCHIAFDFDWWLHNIGHGHDDAELAERGEALWDNAETFADEGG